MSSCIVIEDSEKVRRLVAEMVAGFGLKVRTASSSQQGVEMIAADPGALVLLDWDLPKLGALDVLGAIAEAQLPERPAIVLLATENEPKQFALARAAGATHYILKPFDRSDLAGVLEKAGISVRTAA